MLCAYLRVEDNGVIEACFVEVQEQPALREDLQEKLHLRLWSASASDRMR